jgi:hypothetical protein
MARTGSFVLVLVLLAGCHSALNGQRVSLRHDAAADEFHVLIHNDGIHGKGDDPKKSAEEVKGALEGAGLFWWDFDGWLQATYLRKDAVADAREEEEEEAVEVSNPHLKAMAGNSELTTIGHYFDGKGRIGALQFLRFRNLRAFLQSANAAIRESDLEAYFGETMPKTLVLVRKEAAKGRDWLSVEGHSVVLSFPVDEAEWKREMARVFLPGCAPGPDSPLSATVADGRVTMRLGLVDGPSTYRFRYRDVPETDLDEAVKEAAPVNLDRQLLAAILGGPEAKVAPAIRAILDGGPPEERVRALLRGAVHEDPDIRRRALARLRAFGTMWNRAGHKPVAPKAAKTPADLQKELDAWWAWHLVIVRKIMHPPRPRTEAVTPAGSKDDR